MTRTLLAFARDLPRLHRDYWRQEQRRLRKARRWARSQAGRPYRGWSEEDKELLDHYGATQAGLILCAAVKSGLIPNPLHRDPRVYRQDPNGKTKL